MSVPHDPWAAGPSPEPEPPPEPREPVAAPTDQTIIRNTDGTYLRPASPPNYQQQHRTTSSRTTRSHRITYRRRVTSSPTSRHRTTGQRRAISRDRTISTHATYPQALISRPRRRTPQRNPWPPSARVTAGRSGLGTGLSARWVSAAAAPEVGQGTSADHRTVRPARGRPRHRRLAGAAAEVLARVHVRRQTDRQRRRRARLPPRTPRPKLVTSRHGASNSDTRCYFARPASPAKGAKKSDIDIEHVLRTRAVRRR